MGLTQPVQLSPYLAVHPSAPVNLDSTWENWLGSIQAGQFRNSEFVIVAQLENPILPVNHRERVERVVDAFHCALLLLGFGYCSGGLEVGGNTDNGHLH